FEKQLIRFDVIKVGKSLDVTGGAIDELEIAGHDPDHVIAHDAAEPHHRAGGKRVEQHFQTDAHRAVQQEIIGRYGHEHGDAVRIPAGDELTDFSTGLRGAEEDDADLCSVPFGGFKLLALKSIR